MTITLDTAQLALIERCARALFDFDRLPHQPGWDKQMPEFHEHCRNRVRHVLARASTPAPDVEALRADNERLRVALELYTDDVDCGLCERPASSGAAARAALASRAVPIVSTTAPASYDKVVLAPTVPLEAFACPSCGGLLAQDADNMVRCDRCALFFPQPNVVTRDLLTTSATKRVSREELRKVLVGVVRIGTPLSIDTVMSAIVAAGMCVVSDSNTGI